MPPEPAPSPAADHAVEPYAWRMLAVLMVVYVLNFVDRQLLTILAPDLKRDLGIGDAEFGFLYGTAFGVFYALFGIPLGKLADRWSRVKLLTLGLSLWSAMTALSGLSRNFAQIAATRVGVGIGEASAAPCAYSLIADYFPPQRRATALGIYSAGLYVGAGISMFLGSSIATAWNEAFAPGARPLGLAGWQAAFLAVGIPGLLLAFVVSRLREPLRGRFDGGAVAAVAPGGPSPWRQFLADVGEMLPPFTLLSAARRGQRALAGNVAMAAAIALAMAGLVRWLGDPVQWIAVGVGVYAAVSWMTALAARDPAAFADLLKSRAFVFVTLGYALVSFVGYASTAFTPLYAIESLGADPRNAGFIIGGMGAVGGSFGVIAGGIFADRQSRRHGQAGRVGVILGATVLAMASHAVIFSTGSLALFYAAVLPGWVFTAATLGGAAGLVVNIVRPDLRGTATAVFLLGTNIIGLALGPYTAGKLSEVFGSLGLGMLSLLAVVPAIVILLVLALRELRKG
jgi:MFS family permease